MNQITLWIADIGNIIIEHCSIRNIVNGVKNNGMIETINHNGNLYPKFQSEGFASKFAFPFANEVCKGVGYDVGCNRKEWCLPQSIPVDIMMGNGEYHALQLPDMKVDFIFSSHMLEHVANWVDVLDYWKTKLHPGGVLFLYLPHPSQSYWSPWHNRKHIHSFPPELIKQYLTDRGWKNIFVSGVDLNNSFMVMANT